MIITDVTARNILKYSSLELHDLPEHGVIAIDGPNESGKSSIGETICFALFGRTYSLEAEALEKLIRWGEGHCSATVRFRLDDSDHYEVARFLDRDGNQGVRLNRVGEEDNPIARGIEAVENELYNRMGYGYDEFIESFYLAQREITTPHPHSDAVKAMAGISTLEHVAEEYGEEIGQDQGKIDDLQQRLDEVGQELTDLAIQTDLMPSLQQQRDALGDSESRLREGTESLDDVSTDYQDKYPEIRTLRGRKGRTGFLRAISLLLSLLLVGAWVLVSRYGDQPIGQKINDFLSSQLPQWGEQYVPWLLYGGIAFALLFLLFWVRAASLKGRVKEATEAAERLSDRLHSLRQEVPDTEAVADTDQALDTESTEDIISAEHAGEAEAEPLATRPGEQETAALCRRIETVHAQPSEVRDLVGRELTWLRQHLKSCQEEIGGLDEQLWNERERLRKAGNLQQEQASLEGRQAGLQQRIQQRELARELLFGSISHLSQRFNRDLRDLVGRTLPLFTEERYEHLQIDEDLTVRVFSNEKRDFMDLEEISSGTQRQIMLAVRLALSQELVNSSIKGRQFLFLDEPFAFFDQERTRRAIGVLPDLSDEITQIWLVAQEFPGAQTFDVPIACSREHDVLPAV